MVLREERAFCILRLQPAGTGEIDALSKRAVRAKQKHRVGLAGAVVSPPKNPASHGRLMVTVPLHFLNVVGLLNLLCIAVSAEGVEKVSAPTVGSHQHVFRTLA